MVAAPGVAIEDVRKVIEKDQDVGQVSQWTLIRWRFMQNRLSVAGLVLLVLMYFVAWIAPFLEPYDFNEIDTNYQYASPTKLSFVNGRLGACGLTQKLNEANFTWTYVSDCSQFYPLRFFVHGHSYKLFSVVPTDVHLFGLGQGAVAPVAPAAAGQAPAGPTRFYLLGADAQGRDLFSRLLEGSRISLTVGLVGAALALVLGSILGTASGYLGGSVDNFIQRFIELLSSIPTIPLWAAFAAALPRTVPVVQRYFLITLILSLLGWTGLARQVRGKVMAYRSLDYTHAARLAGASSTRIILTHMLPNAVSHILVAAAFAVPAGILGETALSFLGLGILPPAVSWGVLLKDAQQIQAVQQHAWLLIPAVPVIVTVVCYQLLADGLRDAADPYS